MEDTGFCWRFDHYPITPSVTRAAGLHW